ncbi:MAG: DUF1540 domain-containing protein [Lachnospiraceae bacterium]|nr:DUF1540 domain-containing protein [Lachnospiraceae bacterium]
MPALVCSAKNCMYNDSMYCCKDGIQVGGEQAKVCQDTCCESFHERSDSAKDSCGCDARPNRTMDIRCEARACEYNDSCVCHANHVDIAGVSACRCEETECVTFNEK